MDLRYIACDILNELGITNVTISKSCTYNDNFYSYRKDKITEDLSHSFGLKNDY